MAWQKILYKKSTLVQKQFVERTLAKAGRRRKSKLVRRSRDLNALERYVENLNIAVWARLGAKGWPDQKGA